MVSQIMRIGVIYMDYIITFFRDILDGPLYIVVVIVCAILICSCIGYLGEQYLNKKKAKDEFEATHAEVAPDSSSNETLTNLEGEVVDQLQQLY